MNFKLVYPRRASLAAVLLTVAAFAAEDISPKPDTPAESPGEPVVEVVDLSVAKLAAPSAGEKIDTDLQLDIVKSRAEKRAQAAAAPAKPAQFVESKPASPPKPIEPSTPPEPPPAPRPTEKKERGFESVLSGTLQADREITAALMPHLISGVLIVPAKVTLKIGAGATIHLRRDPSAQKPSDPSVPDPTKNAVIWVYGKLIVAGECGLPVEFLGVDKESNASILLYGGERSSLTGARFRGVDLAQSGGLVQWSNCEFNETKYCALASGAAMFTHCTFKKCGGIFAAYDEGPWALLARKCLFENCRDGLMFGRDPGQACLVVEKNNFINTRGANLRIMPRSGAATKTPEELLIGENWYGSRIDEEIEHRIVDNRSDRTLKAHLNTRQPADKPYQNVGAGVDAATALNTLQEQQPQAMKMLQALAARQQKGTQSRARQ